MENQDILPHLFKTEYRKIISVLIRFLGLENIEIAEDIVSDTFLLAAETWGIKGLPRNPPAWLSTVARNKTRDYLRRNMHFSLKVKGEFVYSTDWVENLDLDMSEKNIEDSTLSMMFALSHPSISRDSQIALSLNILCGFGAEEIASAFLTNKEVIYKRIHRAKEKLRIENIQLQGLESKVLMARLPSVLTTLYLLFNEGYYSVSSKSPIRRDLCFEALRLNQMLVNNVYTRTPEVYALMAIMCFHSSRLNARTDRFGGAILYEDQNQDLWDTHLIEMGDYYLFQSAWNETVSKYHLEASIAYYHSRKEITLDKWKIILQLYEKLLQLEYSPLVVLNLIYVKYKVFGPMEALVQLEDFSLAPSFQYYSLLGILHSDLNKDMALYYYEMAYPLAKSEADRNTILKKLNFLGTP